MKTWVIGIGVLLLWSAGSTYWYVCKIKGGCWEATTTIAPATIANIGSNETIGSRSSNVAGISSIADSIKVPLPDSGTTSVKANNFPAKLQRPYTVLFVFAGGPMPDDPKDFEAYLDELVAYLKTHSSEKALLLGYTDDTAARENNLKLAQRRCDVIGVQLTQRGLDATQIVTEPRGELDPVASNETEAGRRLNRRVVISIQR